MKIEELLTGSPKRETFIKNYETGNNGTVVLHDLPEELLVLGKLPDAVELTKPFTSLDDYKDATWFIVPNVGSSNVSIIAHRKFLEIQDQFNELEQGFALKLGDKIEWGAKETLEAFAKYMLIYHEHLGKTNNIFKQALAALPIEEKNEIESYMQRNKLPTVGVVRAVVAIPWYADDPDLWNDFYQIPETMRKSFGFKPIQSLSSNNLVFASKIRIDGKEYHDLFSRAARDLTYNLGKGPLANMLESLWISAKHEACHGPNDKLIIYLLGLGYRYAVSLAEGVAVCRSGDPRVTATDLPAFVDFLAEPMSTTPSLNRIKSYYQAPKVFLSLKQLIAERERLSDDEVWAKIMSSMIHVAWELRKELPNNASFHQKGIGAKTKIFFDKLYKCLKIPVDDICTRYDLLNSG